MKMRTPQIWIPGAVLSGCMKPITAGYCIMIAAKYNMGQHIVTENFVTIRDLMLAGF